MKWSIIIASMPLYKLLLVHYMDYYGLSVGFVEKEEKDATMIMHYPISLHSYRDKRYTTI